MECKVSIIIPAYNAEKYIISCIESIEEQTYKTIEIIIVNDGSNDRTEYLCNQLKTKYDNIIIITTNNKGVSSARNTGINKATGKYIMFCDSDDLLHFDMIKRLVLEMEESGVDVCCCSYERFSAEVAIKKLKYVQESFSKNYLEEEEMYKTIFFKPMQSGYLWNKLFRFELIIQDRGLKFDEDLAILEDELFVIRYLMRCKKMCILEGSLYFYRENSQGALSQQISDNLLTQVIARERIYIEIKNNEILGIDIKKYTWNQMMVTYCYFYQKLLYLKFSDKKRWFIIIANGIKKYSKDFKFDESWNVKYRIYYILVKFVMILKGQ